MKDKYILEQINYENLKKIEKSDSSYFNSNYIIYLLDTLTFNIEYNLNLSDINYYGKIIKFAKIKHPVSKEELFLIQFEKKFDACLSQILLTLKYKNIKFYYFKTKLCINCFKNKFKCNKKNLFFHNINKNSYYYINTEFHEENIWFDLEISFYLWKYKFNIFNNNENSINNDIILILFYLIKVTKNNNFNIVNEFEELDNSIKKIKFEPYNLSPLKKKEIFLNYEMIKNRNNQFLLDNSLNSSLKNTEIENKKNQNNDDIQYDNNKNEVLYDWMNELFSYNQFMEFYNETFIYLNLLDNKSIKNEIDNENKNKFNLKNNLNKSFYYYNKYNKYEDENFIKILINFTNNYQEKIKKKNEKNCEFKSIFLTKNERKLNKRLKKKQNKKNKKLIEKKNNEVNLNNIKEDNEKKEKKIEDIKKEIIKDKVIWIKKDEIIKEVNNNECIDLNNETENLEKNENVKKKRKRKRRKKKKNNESKNDSINKILDDLNEVINKNKSKSISKAKSKSKPKQKKKLKSKQKIKNPFINKIKKNSFNLLKSNENSIIYKSEDEDEDEKENKKDNKFIKNILKNFFKKENLTENNKIYKHSEILSKNINKKKKENLINFECNEKENYEKNKRKKSYKIEWDFNNKSPKSKKKYSKNDQIKKSLIMNIIDNEYNFEKNLKNLDKNNIWEKITNMAKNDNENLENMVEKLKNSNSSKKLALNDEVFDLDTNFNLNKEDVKPFNKINDILQQLNDYDFNQIYIENTEDYNYIFFDDDDKNYFKDIEHNFNKLINKFDKTIN